MLSRLFDVDDAPSQRHVDGRRPFVDPQLREDVLHVHGNGVLAQAENGGDLLVAFSLGYELQHLNFTHLGLANVPESEVVGVVDDMRLGSIGSEAATFGGVLDPPIAEIFLSHRRWPFPIEDLLVVIRTTDDPAALAAVARTIVREEDPTLPVDSILTMEDRVAASLAGPRSYAVFLVGFALCALAIAGVGLFGVLSYTTSQRTREIGLRSALGATRNDVLALVGEQALTIICVGLATGLAAAFFLSQSVAKLLYGIPTRDSISFLVVPLVLIVVSILACAGPAWRATRIDPLAALRTE
jgi:putative ABC transport system permease protein